MLVGNIKGESRFVEAIDTFLYTLKEGGRPFQAVYKYLKDTAPRLSKGQCNRIIKRLEESNRIRFVERNGKIFVELTKKGKLKALLEKVEMNKYKKWDSRWRLMIWDIPESSSRQRDSIRRFVKRLGFYQLQKSVYITPFELSGEAIEYLNLSGLWKFIRFLRVDRLDNELDLKKYFRLNVTHK